MFKEQKGCNQQLSFRGKANRRRRPEFAQVRRYFYFPAPLGLFKSFSSPLLGKFIRAAAGETWSAGRMVCVRVRGCKSAPPPTPSGGSSTQRRAPGFIMNGPAATRPYIERPSSPHNADDFLPLEWVYLEQPARQAGLQINSSLCLPARALYANERRARSNSNNAFNLWQEHLNFLGNIRVALRASAAQFMTCDPHCQRVLYSYKTWAYICMQPHIFHGSDRCSGEENSIYCQTYKGSLQEIWLNCGDFWQIELISKTMLNAVLVFLQGIAFSWLL